MLINVLNGRRSQANKDSVSGQSLSGSFGRSFWASLEAIHERRPPRFIFITIFPLLPLFQRIPRPSSRRKNRQKLHSRSFIIIPRFRLFIDLRGSGQCLRNSHRASTPAGWEWERSSAENLLTPSVFDDMRHSRRWLSAAVNDFYCFFTLADWRSLV